MNLKRSRRRVVNLGVVACLLLSFLFAGPLPPFGQGTAAANTEEPPVPPDEPHIPGTLEGTSTYFELTDSEYLNLTLASTEPVHLALESVPEMIVMHLEAAGEASSTVISISGFPASTTYYKYEDDYHNEVTFTTDGAGGYTYAQDLTEPHLIFIQPRGGTKFIRDDATGGDCTSIGDWDWASKTCTLTTDLYEAIQIVSDGISLDGNGHTVTGTGTGFGVYLSGRTGVTLTDLRVKGFNHGVGLYSSHGNILRGNDASTNNNMGIYLTYSNNNSLAGNTANYNGYNYGIYLGYSSNNTLAGNTAMNNERCGITLFRSDTNNLTSNTANFSILFYGIALHYSDGNTLADNTANSNNQFGMHLSSSHNNNLTGNTANSNNHYGILLSHSSGNTVNDNITSDNREGIFVAFSSSNTLANNTASSNDWGGIHLYSSSSNTLTGNTARWNGVDGIGFYFSSNHNTLTDNYVSNNSRGMYLHFCSDNEVYNNNLVENSVQAYVFGGGGNIFNMGKPVGGNYWSNWTSPDDDGDGFVDDPYVFPGGQDDLPWTRQDGWKTIRVDIDIKPGSHPNCFNVNGHGVIPVAILGSAEFDVTQIDVSTVSFAGLEVRVKGNDNAQCSVADVSGDFTSPEGAPDGWADLVCHFVDDPASWCPGDSTATLNGSLLDGRAFEGTDEICIVP